MRAETVAERAIGVFDSGVGGLTVLKELRRQVPGEKLIYLGDTARVPYGTKSATTVLRYAHEAARFLLEQKVKLFPYFLRRKFQVEFSSRVELGRGGDDVLHIHHTRRARRQSHAFEDQEPHRCGRQLPVLQSQAGTAR